MPLPIVLRGMTGLGRIESDVDIAQLPRPAGKSCLTGTGSVGEAIEFREFFLLE